ncbi:MAG: NADH-quinone oxidoreductase subunit NuoG [candidate division Zixibacteria bacterium]|nr:NADH-quinone oxidoreductase subunit NuoG [candidate division Zixibacteria bacterium]MDD5425046.1 NADH-quinone oxidoreductase subunit NuoG [candidate division Zixibacteria bacterium]
MADKQNPETGGQATVTLTIDGLTVTVPRGYTVLEAARSIGINIPTFCWHPKLKPVGACRICYVEIEKFPKLQVSCATVAMDGMVVHTNTDQVKNGRRAVLEFILLNHPLDCPTCDKGGECDLQNLTFAHGLDDSRFAFQKYRFVDDDMTTTFDDKRIGPEIILNRNRCILCYKCVRANKEAFGEYDLGAYERGNITEINAAPGRQVANPFSGNLVEICPVGALTNTDWRYKIRVWLTKTTPSICNFSSSGTNILFYKEDHKNKIYRVTSRRNDDIDDGWLADITRYSYQVITSDERLIKPLIKKEGKQVPATWEEALEVIKKRLNEIKDKKGGVCIGGLASPSLDNASLYSFAKFLRRTFNSNKLDYRQDYRMLPKDTANNYSILASQPFKIAGIDDSDVIVTFATDLLREHQNEYLRVRKAFNFKKARIFVANPYAVKTADVAELEMVYKVGTDEIFINAVCLAALEENLVACPDRADLKKKIKPSSLKDAAEQCGVAPETIKIMARALAEGKKVTFIAGELLTRCRDREIIASALCNLNRLFGLNRKGQIAVLARYANSMGAVKLGISPEPVPALKKELEKIWSGLPDTEAYNTDTMLVHMKKEEINGFIIMGANPVMLYPDREFVKESLEKLDFLVVCDLYETETTALADVVLPLAGWAEYAGDYINLEGCRQHAEQALKPRFEAYPGYEILEMIADKFEKKLFSSTEERESEIDRLLKVDTTLPWPDGFVEVKTAEIEIEKDYPLALFLCDDPHHCGHLTEKANSLVNFCGEAYIEMAEEQARAYNLNEGDSVRLESPIGKIIVPLKISEHLDNQVVLVPRNFTSHPVTSLLMRKRRIDWVRISKVAE